jgi:hypothetical protein
VGYCDLSETAEGSSIDTIRGKSLVNKPEDVRKALMTDEDGDTYMPPVLMMPTSTRNTIGKETSCRTWHKLESAARSNQTVRIMVCVCVSEKHAC